MMIDWTRVLRTLIQSASGAGIALLTAIAADWSRGAVIAAVMQFGITVAVAVLMNIKAQTDKDAEGETK